MSETIVCPGCRRKLRLPSECLGHTAQCPACKKQFGTSEYLPLVTLVAPAPPPAAPAEPVEPREEPPPRRARNARSRLRVAAPARKPRRFRVLVLVVVPLLIGSLL